MGYKMDYETFRQEMKKLVEEGLQEKGDYSCSWQPVHKNNVTKTALRIMEKGSRASIMAYLDLPYQDYLKGQPLSAISREIIRLNTEKEFPDISTKQFSDYGEMKGKLRLRLVGREHNEAYLEEGPYRVHPMGAEILYAELEKTGEGRMGFHVTHEHLADWGIPEQEAFDTALENSQREEPIWFQSLAGRIASTLLWEDPGEGPVSKNEMYVLSNQSKDHGAAVLLYPAVPEELHRKMQGDYYILPSSVHEVIILSKETDFTPAALRDMVVEINQEVVSLEDRLGNDVYEFQGRTGTLQKCKIPEKERTR